MKSFFNLHSLDADSINERLKELDYRIFLLELSHRGADRHIFGKSLLHSEIIQQIANHINAIEFVPGDKCSFTINITIK